MVCPPSEFSLYTPSSIPFLSNCPGKTHALKVRPQGAEWAKILWPLQTSINSGQHSYPNKHKTALYDLKTKEKINLLELLTRHGSVDMTVLVGNDKNIKLRLLATPVPEEIANLRRMKAKKENKNDPSQELLLLMSWTIFIVTIENQAITRY